MCKSLFHYCTWDCTYVLRWQKHTLPLCLPSQSQHSIHSYNQFGKQIGFHFNVFDGLLFQNYCLRKIVKSIHRTHSSKQSYCRHFEMNRSIEVICLLMPYSWLNRQSESSWSSNASWWQRTPEHAPCQTIYEIQREHLFSPYPWR